MLVHGPAPGLQRLVFQSPCFRSKLKTAAAVRKAHCLSCNSKFHRIDPKLPGFQKFSGKLQSDTAAIAQSQERHYDDILSKMTPEQHKAAGIDMAADLGVPVAEGASGKLVKSRLRQHRKLDKQSKYCRWCLDASHGLSSPLKPAESKQAILDAIPASAQIVHVIDALDFPLSLDKSLHTVYGPRVQYVINRGDLAVGNSNHLKKFKAYCMDTVFTPLGIEADRVHVVSAKRGWQLTKLAEILGPQNYFVGKTNSGKTTLAMRLAGEDPSSSTWSLPFTTQTSKEYRTTPNYRLKRVVDTPSFPEESRDGKGIFDLLDRKYLRKVSDGAKMIKYPNKYSVKSTMAKPGRALSVAGIVGLDLPKGPPGSAVHAWPIYGGHNPSLARATSSIERVDELNRSQNKDHQTWNILDSTKAEPPKLVKKLELPLTKHNSPSVVVRGLGMVQAKPYGSLEDPYIVDVYGPEGVEMGLREEAFKWLVSSGK